jgi:hypothetical protein
MEYCENFRHAKEEVRKRMTGVNSSWIRTRTQIGFMRDIEETLPKKFRMVQEDSLQGKIRLLPFPLQPPKVLYVTLPTAGMIR